MKDFIIHSLPRYHVFVNNDNVPDDIKNRLYAVYVGYNKVCRKIWFLLEFGLKPNEFGTRCIMQSPGACVMMNNKKLKVIMIGMYKIKGK